MSSRGSRARGAWSTARNPLPVIGFIRTTSSQDYTPLVPAFHHGLGEMGLTRRFSYLISHVVLCGISIAV
jgi:hypothetical protein